MRITWYNVVTQQTRTRNRSLLDEAFTAQRADGQSFGSTIINMLTNTHFKRDIHVVSRMF